MENSKQLFEKEKRVQASKEVKIQFQNPNDFVVLDDKESIKYYGHIGRSDKEFLDECSCPSWVFGMRFDKATEEVLKGESNFFRDTGE